MRYALVKNAESTERLARFLPDNYKVLDEVEGADGRMSWLIGGSDKLGWTLDDYVIPRLASGLIFCTEAPACFRWKGESHD